MTSTSLEELELKFISYLLKPIDLLTLEDHLYESNYITTYINSNYNIYDFNENSISILKNICMYRLNSSYWENKNICTLNIKLSILQLIRILTRDINNQIIFINNNNINNLPIIINILNEITTDLFINNVTDNNDTIIQIIIELSNIIKRFSIISNSPFLTDTPTYILTSKCMASFVYLLTHHEVSIVHTILLILLNLSNSSSTLFYDSCSQYSILDPILFIFSEDNNLTIRTIAGELLLNLLNYSAFRLDALSLHIIPVCMRLLHSTDQVILFSLQILTLLCNCESSDPIYVTCRKEVRQVGGISVILSLINREKGQVVADIAVAVCNVLTHLAFDDENSMEIRKKHGVYMIGDLLLQTLNLSCTALKPSGIVIDPNELQSARVLQLNALRALRFIFSTERNRRVFKHIFAPELFAAFIDIGHYIYDIAAFEQLIPILDSISASTYQQMVESFDELKSVSISRKQIGNFLVEEIIGKGAFGTVYQVCSLSDQKHYAMKQIPINYSNVVNEISDNGISSIQVKSVCKEVDIISKLDHPNIVHYYTSFEFQNELYIVMELVDGVSLADYLSSLAEKDSRILEEHIWPIFIQICLALSYLHLEQRIVHRDLTPNNILIDSSGRVKIADFGLASERISYATLLQSVVGTISYSCPEIVQHQPYTDKADIWSLGCILYQMAQLEPPFAGGNPLTVAHKIVQGEYNPIDSTRYSNLLRQIVKKLLSVPTDARPDIVQVSQMISPLLMTELDRLNSSLMQAENKLALKTAKLEKAAEKDPSEYRVLAPSTSSHHISILNSRLKSIKDPVENLLSQFHKLIYASETSLSILRDGNLDPNRRTAILRYKRFILALKTDSKAGFETLKEEIKKLESSSTDIIPLESEHESQDSEDQSSKLTYDILHRYIEKSLHDSHYYNKFGDIDVSEKKINPETPSIIASNFSQINIAAAQSLPLRSNSVSSITPVEKSSIISRVTKSALPLKKK